MSAALILEFENAGLDLYEGVNDQLGIDMQTGEGDWPQGLLFHTAAAKPGGFVIYEIWSSQADQERFLGERLGPAMQQVGVPEPARTEWLELASARNLGL